MPTGFGSKKPWTVAEEELLRENYASWTTEELISALNRTELAITAKAFKLGVKSGRPTGFQVDSTRYKALSRFTPWTDEEDAIIRQFYNREGKVATSSRLVGREPETVRSRARTLGVTRTRLGVGKQENFYDSSLWVSTLRPQVLERDGFACQEPSCSVVSLSGEKLRVHHIVPRRLTFDDRPCNLVTLCDPHHRRQEAHWWDGADNIDVDTLPFYQQLILEAI